MTSPTEVIGTEPPELLDAMLRLIRREGRTDAELVTGYRERSFNIGYCESCWDMVSEVRIFYRRADGTDAHYQVDYTGLGELIRKLTDDPDEVTRWDDQALHESEDERSDRFNAHGFDEEPGDR